MTDTAPSRPPAASAPRVAKILADIVERRREHLAATPGSGEAVEVSGGGDAGAGDVGAGPVPFAVDDQPFLAALAARRGRAVIAEVKLGSPRIGSLVDRIDPERQARLYRDHGAAALSVVVEPDFFHGSYELLTRAKEASGLPAIAKDFVVDPLQLRWAADAGADAVLLIAALHPAETLRAWARRARELGLVPLVETHDHDDLAKLAGTGPDGAAGWELVGINNRDLRTFEVDLERSARLVEELPAASLKVAESGIASGREVERLGRAGFDAFLVGESLLLADDPAAVLADLLGVEAPVEAMAAVDGVEEIVPGEAPVLGEAAVLGEARGRSAKDEENAP